MTPAHVFPPPHGPVNLARRSPPALAATPDLAPAVDRPWFARDARVIARALVGCRLVHVRAPDDVRVARIVETEAYCGPRDLACHARAGLTKRTRTLLGPEGHAYVYFVYGMHHCFNVVCKGEGTGNAVLVRAAEAEAGFEAGARLDGPGRFAQAMAIDRALDGADLTGARLFVLPRDRRPRIEVTPRVGVGYSGEWADRPWRFLDAKSTQVSRPPRSAVGRGA